MPSHPTLSPRQLKNKRAHRRQVWLQVWLPVLLIMLIVVAVVVGVIIWGGKAGLSGVADALLVLCLFPCTLLCALSAFVMWLLAAGVMYGKGAVRPLFWRAQNKLESASERAEGMSKRATMPVVTLGARWARLRGWLDAATSNKTDQEES